MNRKPGKNLGAALACGLMLLVVLVGLYLYWHVGWSNAEQRYGSDVGWLNRLVDWLQNKNEPLP